MTDSALPQWTTELTDTFVTDENLEMIATFRQPRPPYRN